MSRYIHACYSVYIQIYRLDNSNLHLSLLRASLHIKPRSCCPGAPRRSKSPIRTRLFDPDLRMNMSAAAVNIASRSERDTIVASQKGLSGFSWISWAVWPYTSCLFSELNYSLNVSYLIGVEQHSNSMKPYATRPVVEGPSNVQLTSNAVAWWVTTRSSSTSHSFTSRSSSGQLTAPITVAQDQVGEDRNPG
jgi:hypothetical protein